MDNVVSTASQDGLLGHRRRVSEETFASRNNKKKSGFASFMTSMLGTPRRLNISAPENPVHLTHVGYDNATGQFTVRF